MSFDNPINPNLEGDNYGNAELNEAFSRLTPLEQKQLKTRDKDAQISLLEKIINPEYINFYNKLSSENKKYYDNMFIYEKYAQMSDDNYGNDELNGAFNRLSPIEKRQLKSRSKELRKSVLEKIIDPEYINFYKNLSTEKKKYYDNMFIYDRYAQMSSYIELAKKQKQTKEVTKSSEISDSTSEYPQMKDEYKAIFDLLDPTTKMNIEDIRNIDNRNAALERIKKHYDKTGKIDTRLVYGKESDLTSELIKSDNKIAIIIPFRESDKAKNTRTNQLHRFVKYFQKYLKGVDYMIYVIEQSDDNRKFNRGALLNIGFLKAEEDGCNVFIFHDVDLLPSEDLKEYYLERPALIPVHIAAVWDRYNKNPNYFGGIVAFNSELFKKINGYPNNFWGWGGEDDELFNRVKHYSNILKVKKGSITDMEELGLQEKLDYLRENDLKFMQKREALAEHRETWKKNGLNSLGPIDILSTKMHADEHYIIITVDLENIGDTSKLGIDLRGQEGLFGKEKIRMIQEDKKLPPAKAFDKLMKLYVDNSMRRTFDVNHEFEIRFGTKGIKPLTKNDYDNVIKVLKSLGFASFNPSGLFSLRAKCEFLDSSTGRFKMSDIRTEIEGLSAIEKYCKSNDIKTVYKELPHSIKFLNKRPYVTPEKTMVRPVNFDDFNFRASYAIEETATKGVENYILENWRKSKKEFRYLNRVTFRHPEYPVLVDLSIVKSGNTSKDSRGFNHITPVYTLEESNVFNNKETYEIEIEVDNRYIGETRTYQSSEAIVTLVRKVIKFVLSGLQGTMYPVSYNEQEEVLRDYMKMIWKEEYEPHRRITTYNFIGPSPITLQLTNVAPIDENSTTPNIRKDFVVTEKADGERHLMYISNLGKIYLISSNMDVKFTGARTTNKDCYDTLFDGELVKYDKNGKFINLYAAFDIYFHKGKDIRHYTFVLTENESDVYKSRYYLLEKLKTVLNPISILETRPESIFTNANQKEFSSHYNGAVMSPIRFEVKKFYPMSSKQTIFDGCKLILERDKQGLFEYEVDGLIFTHEFYGVGSNVIGKAGPKTKVTWEHSFKWKPPHYNTIDFLVTTIKSPNGEDIIHNLFEDGVSSKKYIQFNQYKMLELRCGFSEKNDGFVNPCQDIIDDKLPEYKPRFEDKQSNDYFPKRFYPTEPYDVNAGLCKILLKDDDAGALQMFTKNKEIITDNTIVEFAYNINGQDGWNWEPLRVRYDKTSKLLRGEREYGNSYRVCNENWKSIHPNGRITEDMLMTGQGIPEITVSEDVYYNTPAGKMKTESLKKFHNLYVKKLLINGVSKRGDTLIDFACGKGGDLPKWIASNLSFVFGIDISPDNLENRLDGACSRYLSLRKTNKHMPYALFVNGNSAFNIRDGSAMLNDKAKQVTAAVFGNGPKDPEVIGKGVSRQYGIGDSGFNVSSCQFAIHYFFESPDSLLGFLKNVTQCTKLNGYFIGTSYDGKIIFNELKKIKRGESIQITEEGKRIWEIIKDYGSDNFEDNSSSIGYKINVYQDSINQYISEYLVNYDYFDRLMDAYGFKLISKDEATDMGLPSGTGLFSELFINMLDEIKRNKFKETMFGEAPNMTSFEKKISFLNRYFVYKKIREVNIDKLQLELGEYEEAVVIREREDTKKAVVIAKEEVVKNRPKIRKLGKKIELIPATEAVDESAQSIQLAIENDKKKSKKTKATEDVKSKKSKKLLIVESDSDDEF